MLKHHEGFSPLFWFFRFFIVKYFVFVIPVLAAGFWYLPYQTKLFDFLDGGGLLNLFPNARNVFRVPFNDPQKVSVSLVVMNFFSLSILLLTVLCSGKYLRSIEGLSERLPKHGVFQYLKLLLFSFIFIVVFSLWVFWFDGGYSLFFGSYLYENEFFFFGTILVALWADVWCYIALLSLLFKLRGIL